MYDRASAGWVNGQGADVRGFGMAVGAHMYRVPAKERGDVAAVAAFPPQRVHAVRDAQLVAPHVACRAQRWGVLRFPMAVQQSSIKDLVAFITTEKLDVNQHFRQSGRCMFRKFDASRSQHFQSRNER